MPISQLGITAVVGEGVGAEIREVAPESIAAFSGFRVGDVITAIDGSPVKTPMELQAAFSNRAPGARVTVTYLRGYWQSDTTVILK